MLYTGRELSASEALQAGLVSRLMPEGASPTELQAEALRMCRQIAETPRELLVNGKALLKAHQGQPLSGAYDLASEAMECGMKTTSATEGIAAFLQKRHPAWPAEESEIAQAVALVPDGVAIVGASPDPSRPSYGVLSSVRTSGPVYPVNPQAKEVAGIPAVPDLASVAAPSFAIVNVFRSGDAAAQAVDEAIALAKAGRGVRAVWLQLGVRAPEAERRAREAGLLCVADRCLSVELRRRASSL